MAFVYSRLDREKAACLLVDHQTGLFSLVQDFAPEVFKNNVLATAACAKYFRLPTVLTTSMEDGPNGPILPELKAMHPDAAYVARPGQINAFDDPAFAEAVKKTGRRQLVVCGIVTDVCVSFAVLSALELGYEVFVVTDASGTFTDSDRKAAWLRMSAAGAQLINWFALACELHRDWRRDVEGLAAICRDYIPSYANLLTLRYRDAK